MSDGLSDNSSYCDCGPIDEPKATVDELVSRISGCLEEGRNVCITMSDAEAICDALKSIQKLTKERDEALKYEALCHCGDTVRSHTGPMNDGHSPVEMKETCPAERKLDDYKKVIDTIEGWLVCRCICTAEDFANGAEQMLDAITSLKAK